MPNVPTTKDNWKPIHTQILNLYLEGKSPKEICEITGRSRSFIYTVRRSPVFRARAGEDVDGPIPEDEKPKSVLTVTPETAIAKQAYEHLESHVIEAARLVTTIMRTGDSSDRIRYDAAKHVLDISGVKPVNVVETRERAYTPTEVASAKKTIDELVKIANRLTNKESSFILRMPGEAKTQSPDGRGLFVEDNPPLKPPKPDPDKPGDKT